MWDIIFEVSIAKCSKAKAFVKIRKVKLRRYSYFTTGELAKCFYDCF